MDKGNEYKLDGSAEQDTPRIFAGQHLTAIDVPLGTVEAARTAW